MDNSINVRVTAQMTEEMANEIMQAVSDYFQAEYARIEKSIRDECMKDIDIATQQAYDRGYKHGMRDQKMYHRMEP